MSSHRHGSSIRGGALTGTVLDPEDLFVLEGALESLQTCILTLNWNIIPTPGRQPMYIYAHCPGKGTPESPFSMSDAFHLVQEQGEVRWE